VKPKECPKCTHRPLTQVLNGGSFHPTGATGGGLWYFRTFDLYECSKCEEYFYDNNKMYSAEPLRGNDFYKREEY